MSDKKQAPPTVGSVIRTLDPETSSHLMALGFDPEAPVFEAKDWFKHSAIKRKLFEEAGRPGPVILKFGATDWDIPDFDYERCSWHVHVLVELLTARFETDTTGDKPGPVHNNSLKVPEFYIRGFLTDTATDAPPDAPRVHVLIDNHDHNVDDPTPTAFVQIVHEPAPPNPDAQLVLHRGSV